MHTIKQKLKKVKPKGSVNFNFKNKTTKVIFDSLHLKISLNSGFGP